jgi:hypothetical protein
MASMYENLDRIDIYLTVHSRAILKIVKSTCHGIKKIKCTLMKCHRNVNSTPLTQLPHTFSYILAIKFIHVGFSSSRSNYLIFWQCDIYFNNILVVYVANTG